MIERLDIQKEKTLLRDVRILDTKNGTLSGPANVLAAGGGIADTDARSDEAGCHVIDCAGLTLCPGIIECHCHILSPFVAEQRGVPGMWALRQIRRNLTSALACGVVCARDMMSPIGIMNRYRKAISRGKLIGPRILAAGPMLTRLGGYPEFIRPLPSVIGRFTGQPRIDLETPAEAETAVRNLHKQGIDVVKVAYTVLNSQLEPDIMLPVISKEVFDAICTTAHSLGLKVSVHHFCAEDLRNILRHDIDSVEHLPFDRDMTAGEIEAVRTHGVTVVPTLTMTDCSIRFEEKAGFLESAHAEAMFEPRVLQYLKGLAATWLDFSDPEYLKSFGAGRGKKDVFGSVFRNSSALAEAGVRLCAGTDMGAVTSFPGETVDEARRLHLVGLSRLEAVRAATLYAAELLGVDDRLGAIDVGMDADVILIDGDPLEDLDALRRIRIIGKSGRWFKPVFPELPDFWPGHGLFLKPYLPSEQ